MSNNNSIETQNNIDYVSRFLAEIRMYETRGESVARFILWIATLYLGTGEIFSNKQTNSTVVNLFVIGFSFFLDLFINVLKRDEVYIDSLKRSRAVIVLTTLISLVLLIMSVIYILSESKDGFKDYYLLAMFWMALILAIKPLLDFVAMMLFPKSINYFENVRHKTTDEKIDNLMKIMTDAAKKGTMTD